MTSPPSQATATSPPRLAIAELGLVTSGKLVSLGSLLLCSLLVARASGDAGEYGLYAAGLSLALILDAAIGFPLDISTVRFAALHSLEPARVDRLQAAGVRVKLLIGLVLLAAATLSGGAVSRAWLGSGARTGLLEAALLCTLALLLARSTAVRLQVEHRFERYAALDAIQGALRLLAIAGAIWLGCRSGEAFLAAHAVGSALAFGVGLLLLPRAFLRAGWPGRRDLREAAVHAGLMAGIVVLGTITGRADVPILASARSAADAGQYAIALQIATILTLLASYASVIMQPRVLRMALEGRIATLWRWNALGAAGLSAAAAAVAAWVLPGLIPILFGARFAPAVPIVAVLLVGTCADLFFMPVPMMFSIQVSPATSLAGEALITAGFFGALALGWGGDTIAMAWLVTAVRCTKLLLYAGITAAHLGRPRSSPA